MAWLFLFLGYVLFVVVVCALFAGASDDESVEDDGDDVTHMSGVGARDHV